MAMGAPAPSLPHHLRCLVKNAFFLPRRLHSLKYTGSHPKISATNKQNETQLGPLEFYATCFPGLEEVVAEELRSPLIGATDVVPAKAGVAFRGRDVKVAYLANLWLRSAIRVLALVARGRIDPTKRGAEEVYCFTRTAAHWTNYLYKPDMHFTVTGHAAECSDIRSGYLLSTRVKDAICDVIRFETGHKPVPAPPGEDPDIHFIAVAYRDIITLYRNMSGDSLHRRGYRGAIHKAALNEATAAGLLLMMGWDDLCSRIPHASLADPMCGSGTFLIEAAFIAERRAPGLMRRSWTFESWHDFDMLLWNEAVASSASMVREFHGSIWGSDIHEGALWLAKTGIREAGVENVVKLKMCGVKDLHLPHEPLMVITNPPWGHRLAKGLNGRDEQDRTTSADTELQEVWTELGLFLKRECRNASVGVLNGGKKDITRELCLRADRRYPISVGGVDARLLKYSILPPK